MKAYKIFSVIGISLIVFIIVAFLSLGKLFPYPVSGAVDAEAVTKIAISKNDSDICGQMSHDLLTLVIYSTILPGPSLDSLKNVCYRKYAIATGDIAACKNTKNYSKSGPEEYCYTAFALEHDDPNVCNLIENAEDRFTCLKMHRNINKEDNKNNQKIVDYLNENKNNYSKLSLIKQLRKENYSEDLIYEAASIVYKGEGYPLLEGSEKGSMVDGNSGNDECFNSDENEDNNGIYIKGTLVISSHNTSDKYEHNDFCRDDRVLIEKGCKRYEYGYITVSEAEYTCSNKCIDGACVD